MTTKTVKAPKGGHWMKKGSSFKLMKGTYKPHKGAVQMAKLAVQKQTWVDIAKSQRSLKAWGRQKWRTKSGKKSSETGGEKRTKCSYPKCVPASENARATVCKSKSCCCIKKKGKQLSKQPKAIASKVRRPRLRLELKIYSLILSAIDFFIFS
jgi:hypothetical protein